MSVAWHDDRTTSRPSNLTAIYSILNLPTTARILFSSTYRMKAEMLVFVQPFFFYSSV